MTPSQQQEAANQFELSQELAAYGSVVAACMYCGRPLYELYRHARRQMREERQEHRRRMAEDRENALYEQAQEVYGEGIRHVHDDEGHRGMRQDEGPSSSRIGSASMRPPSPVGQMEYGEGTSHDVNEEMLFEQAHPPSSRSRRRQNGSSSRISH